MERIRARWQATYRSSERSAVTPDQRWAISGSDDRTLKVWNLESGEVVATHTGSVEEIHAVAVTSDSLRSCRAGLLPASSSPVWGADSISDVCLQSTRLCSTMRTPGFPQVATRLRRDSSF